MKKENMYLLKPIMFALLSIFLLASCADSGVTFGEACNVDDDCADGLVCNDGICQKTADGDAVEEDKDAVDTETEADVTLDCEDDWDCPIDFRCMDGICIENTQCKSDTDCQPGQTCKDGVCTGDPIIDGDMDQDQDLEQTENPVDGDMDQDKESDPLCDPCQKSIECADGLICNSDGCCDDPCAKGECPDGMVCNSQNGYCEYCDEQCAVDQCCNLMPGTFWYCGECCEPPCAEGYACQRGQCEPLECRCPPGDICGPETKYLCYTPPVDGDDDGEDPWFPDGDTDWDSGEGERSNAMCLPANSSCMDGIDECCSGTCLMGTCL